LRDLILFLLICLWMARFLLFVGGILAIWFGDIPTLMMCTILLMLSFGLD